MNELINKVQGTFENTSEDISEMKRQCFQEIKEILELRLQTSLSIKDSVLNR